MAALYAFFLSFKSYIDFPNHAAYLNHTFQIDKTLLVGLIYHTLTVGIYGVLESF